MLRSRRHLRVAGALMMWLLAASCVSATPVFSYYNDTPDPSVYKYLIFNPVSTFEVSHIEVSAPGASTITSPAGWTGTLSNGIATWQTILGSASIGPGEELTGFQLTGSSVKAIAPYTISGPQFSHNEVVIVPVPEPGSLLAISSGLVGLLGVVSRRRLSILPAKAAARSASRRIRRPARA